MRSLRRLVVLAATASLSIGLACSQMPLEPGDQPIRPAWDALITPAWDALNAALLIPVIGLVVSAAIGGLIGGVTALYFSRQSSHQLRQEAERLRLHSTVLIATLQNAGLIVGVERNELGEVIGNSVMVRSDTLQLTSELHPPTITGHAPAPSDESGEVLSRS